MDAVPQVIRIGVVKRSADRLYAVRFRGPRWTRHPQAGKGNSEGGKED
jgi:hypothetical protein